MSKALVFTGVLVLCGCASTDKVVLDDTKRVPTTSVEVFKVGEKPTRKGKEIAHLSFLGPREDELKATKHFIAQGKKLGANAIILNPTEGGGMRGNIYGGFGSAFVFKATAVAYEQ